MSQFFDELARTLAQPMPRRRAMGLLGGALVGMAFPAATARAASATHDCAAEGKFLCACPNLDLFYKVCCPNETPEAKYECKCKAPPNGYAQCQKVEGKRCGPDISDALDDALTRVKSTFAGWSSAKRGRMCTSLVTLPAATFSWDIVELGPAGRDQFKRQYSGCSTCGFSVQVGRDCHYSGSVNYVVYGVMMRLCHDHYKQDDSFLADWYSSDEMRFLIYIHKNANLTLTQGANYQASNNWALVGYDTGSIRPTPPGDRPNCARCPTPYTGRGLSVHWFLDFIRP